MTSCTDGNQSKGSEAKWPGEKVHKEEKQSVHLREMQRN